MSAPARWPGVRTAIALVGALLLVWLSLPVGLGGGTAYVTTVGISMEPLFHDGDLAVVRSRSSYAVGDVVAYRSAVLDTTVLHRIVAVQGNRFTTRGDNNSWIDPDHPAPDDVVGALAFRVPHGGRWLGSLGLPSAAGALALLTLAGDARRRRGRGRLRRLADPERRTVPSRLRQPGPTVTAVGVSALTGVLAVAAVLLLSSRVSTTDASPATVRVGAALSAPAPSLRPTPSGPAAVASSPSAPVPTSTQTAAVRRTVDVSYRASVPRTAAYDGTTVVAPQPVFRKLIDTLRLSVRYHGDPADVAVRLRLSTPVGWSSVVPLAPQRRIDGDGELVGQVRLADLQARAEAASAWTGVEVSHLDIVVETVVTAPGRADWVPTTKLTMTPLLLNVPGGEESLHAVQEPPAAPLPGAGPVILGRSLPTPTGPVVVLALVAVALLLGLGGWLLAGHVLAGDDTARIRRRYGDLLVPVSRPAAPPDRPVVEVARFSTLAKLARRYGLLVLHWTNGNGGTTYAVWDDSTVYCHVVARQAVAPSEPPPATRRSRRKAEPPDPDPPPEPAAGSLPDPSTELTPEPAPEPLPEPTPVLRRPRVPPQRRPPQPDRTIPSPRREALAGRRPAHGRRARVAPLPEPARPVVASRHAVRANGFTALVEVPQQAWRSLLSVASPRTTGPRYRHATGVVRRPSDAPPSATGRFPGDWRLDGPVPRKEGPPRRAR